MLTLRYDLRVPEFAPTSHQAQYAACLEQCAWADGHGFTSVVLSEHHGVEDGYLPAPIALAGVIAGRTTSIQISMAALLVALHDPIRLAEQLAVLDLASGGRITFVAGLGYRHEEFEMAGVDRRRRGALVEEYVDVMRRAWTGEPFEWRGRQIVVTPRPATLPHPAILLGGSTEAAAKRAARLRVPFMPAIRDPALADIYQAACEEAGFDGGWVLMPAGPVFVHVSEDPERDWERIAPFVLYDTQTYHGWQPSGQRSQTDIDAKNLDDLKQSAAYRVVTPDECLSLAREAGALVFHPLLGGMPPELGWESLDLFANKVLPRLQALS